MEDPGEAQPLFQFFVALPRRSYARTSNENITLRTGMLRLCVSMRVSTGVVRVCARVARVSHRRNHVVNPFGVSKTTVSGLQMQ